MTFHNIFSAIYILTVEVIDAALAVNPDVDILGNFSAKDVVIDPVRVHNIIYLPVPYVGMFLKRSLTPAKVWSRFLGGVFGDGGEFDCQPIIDWIRFALTRKSGDNQLSPLSMPRPTTLPMYGELFHHWHYVTFHHLPGCDPDLQCAQGSLIATHIGEVVVDLRQYS